MAVKLRSVTVQERGTFEKGMVILYGVYHNNGTTTLNEEMRLDVWQSEVTASMSLSTGALKGTPREAIDKLADNLDRMAKALRERPEPTGLIPVFER